MKDDIRLPNRTLQDGKSIVVILSKNRINNRNHLSFTDIKKSFKQTTNNKLITTALDFLLKEKIIEKKLVDGKIRYQLILDNTLEYFLLINPNSPIMNKYYSHAPSRISEFLMNIIDIYREYFAKNEIAKATQTQPTYNFILTCLQNQVSNFLEYAIQNKKLNATNTINVVLKHCITPFTTVSEEDKAVTEDMEQFLKHYLQTQNLPFTPDPENTEKDLEVKKSKR